MKCADLEFTRLGALNDPCLQHIDGEVPTRLAPILLCFPWRYEGSSGLGSTEWELSKTDEGKKLVLICTGIESFSQDIPEFTRESGKAGWEYFIQQSLPSFLSRA